MIYLSVTKKLSRLHGTLDGLLLARKIIMNADGLSKFAADSCEQIIDREILVVIGNIERMRSDKATTS
jgi:hypothetical protein